MAKYSVTLEDANGALTGVGYYDDVAFAVYLQELDGTELLNQTYVDDPTARAAITSTATANSWTDTVATTAEVPQDTLVARPLTALVFDGVATASPVQDVHGAKSTQTDVNWDNVATKDTALITHTDGDAAIQFPKGNEEFNCNFTVAILDAGLTNRAVYGLRIVHTDSTDAVLRSWLADSAYVHDNADSDSGILNWSGRFVPGQGDKIKVQVEVLDTQTPTGSVAPSAVESKVFIDRVAYAVKLTSAA